MNRVIEVGRLTKDCELRATSTGTSVCTFTIAVDRPRNKDGVKEADFFLCKCFDKQGESIAFYKGKGDMIAIEGRLQNNNWEKDGIKHYSNEIIVERADFLAKEKKAQIEDEAPSRTSDGFGAEQPTEEWKQAQQSINETLGINPSFQAIDDDIPF